MQAVDLYLCIYACWSLGPYAPLIRVRVRAVSDDEDVHLHLVSLRRSAIMRVRGDRETVSRTEIREPDALKIRRQF